MRCPSVEELEGSPAANEAHKVRQDNVPRIKTMVYDVALHEMKIHDWITAQRTASNGCSDRRWKDAAHDGRSDWLGRNWGNQADTGIQ